MNKKWTEDITLGYNIITSLTGPLPQVIEILTQDDNLERKDPI